MSESFDGSTDGSSGTIDEDLFRQAGAGTRDERMPLREKPVEAYLGEGEMIHFLLANDDEGLSVDKLARPSVSRDMTVTSGKEFQPGSNYLALAAITSHRVLFLVGGAGGDDVYQISLENITEATTAGDDDRLILLRDSDLRYSFRGGTQGSEPTVAIRFLRRVQQEGLELPVLTGGLERGVASSDDAGESNPTAESTEAKRVELAEEKLEAVREELEDLDGILEKRESTIESLQNAIETLDEEAQAAQQTDEGLPATLREEINGTRARVKAACDLIREHDPTLSRAEALVEDGETKAAIGAVEIRNDVKTVAATFEERGIDSPYLDELLDALPEPSATEEQEAERTNSVTETELGQNSFGRFVDVLYRLTTGSAEVTDGTLQEWYETLDSFYRNGRQDWSRSYQEVLDSEGSDIPAEIPDTESLEPNSAFVASELLSEELNIRRPVAPESGTPLPLFVESEQHLSRARSLLSEFPAPESLTDANRERDSDASAAAMESSRSRPLGSGDQDDQTEVNKSDDSPKGTEEETTRSESADDPTESSEGHESDDEANGLPPSVDPDGLTRGDIELRKLHDESLHAKLVERDSTPDPLRADLRFEDTDGERFWLRVQEHHEASVEWSVGTWYELRNFFGPESRLGERKSGSLRSASGFSGLEASEAARTDDEQTTASKTGNDDDSTNQTATSANNHVPTGSDSTDDLTDEERERVSDLVELEPTKNSELADRWGLNGGSEVYAYLKGHLDEYYYRDDDSLIRATDEAVASANTDSTKSTSSGEHDNQRPGSTSGVDAARTESTDAEEPTEGRLNPAAYTATLFSAKLDEIDDLDDLRRIEVAEREGKDRVTAKEAIRERRRELQNNPKDGQMTKSVDQENETEDDILGDIEDEFSLDI